MRAVDWLARTAMLVLAALATLSLIGSLASVSDSAIGDAFPGQVVAPVEQGAATPAAEPRILDSDGATMTIEAPVVATAPTPPPPAQDTARWLKALTYAVIALAVFAAAGVVALARIAGDLRRIAGR